ncbi:VOC family protein [Vibrio sp. F74]|uniref:VOC family protein n=1 Tax=Vibrio sp. F74 TaxID=700020 RepID=UPI0035F5C9AD
MVDIQHIFQDKIPMLLGITLGSNDLSKAGIFYDRLLATLNMVRTMEEDDEVGYGPEGGPSCFWILIPFNKHIATSGNGTQVTFKAASNEMVEEFHRVALAFGGTDEGAPGYRYRPDYFGAYCRDLDGNKLHVMHEPNLAGQ